MKKSNFSYFEPIFLLFGGVVTKNAFSKMFLTFRYAFFDTNPQQVFYDFKNPFLEIFGKSIIVWIFGMFLHHPSKFSEFSLKIGGEIICESWPLLTPFFNFRIVHCNNKQCTAVHIPPFHHTAVSSKNCHCCISLKAEMHCLAFNQQQLLTNCKLFNLSTRVST